MKLTILFGLITSTVSVGHQIISTPAVASTYKVTKIHDGDTISVVNTTNDRVEKVRLACIDAPESSQPQGRLSTITLDAFIPVGTQVKLNQVDTDRYGRVVAEVFKNNVNVNISMLNKGQAVVYHRYLSNCPDGDTYIEAEKLAKDHKVGFWNDSSFITPSDYRRGVRPTVSQPETATESTLNRGYMSGSCKYLRTLGLSRFTPGDPNYTSQRDRDNDGVACE